jgi:transposase InsO family protein
LYLRGRGKIGYITGDKKQPDKEGADYVTWDAENSMVMTWLVNSMTEEIGANYLCYATAKDLWEGVAEMYSDLDNQSQIYELTLQLGEIRQADDSVTKYFNCLKRIWQDLDLFNVYEWKSTEDCKHYKKMVDVSRVFKFLAGLNIEFDEVRGRILGRNPIPPIGEVFAEVRREESRRQVMLGKKAPVIVAPPVEGSALAVPHVNRKSFPPRGDDKDNLVCDYCGKNRHTRQDCFKLHGRPNNRKTGKFGDRPASSTNEANSSPFTKEQMDHLFKLLKFNSSPNVPVGTVAQTGKNSWALSVQNHSNPWIIDSGASEHMTNCSHLFSSYFPSSGSEKVRIADGSYSSIAGKGSIKISEQITLQSVLHVPKFACNLLSVHKLSKDTNCSVLFRSSTCVFQDQNSGKMIGTAREMNGLYYFDETPLGNKTACGLNSASSPPVSDQVMLWHKRLGHPSFPYLKYLFPKFAKEINSSQFHCEACHLAKDHRVSFTSKVYSASQPFYLIHSDVWGPSKIKTMSGKKWFVTFIDDHTRVCWVYLLEKKSEVEQRFKDFVQMIENQFQTKIGILRSDNGTEYFNKYLSTFLVTKGIIHQSTCRDTPQQNGVAERKNRHLLEVTRAIMFSMNVPKYLWGNALLTACYLINRMPSRVLKYETPVEVLQNYFPMSRIIADLPLKVFGCLCYVYIPNNFRSKLDPKAEKCVFLGYASNKKGYKCFNPVTKNFFESMDVHFVENQPFFDKNSLQGENHCTNKEDNFWETLPALDDIVTTNHPDAKIMEPRMLNLELPENIVSETGGETLTKDHTPQLQVYVRKKFHQGITDPIVSPAEIQSDLPSEGPTEISPSSSSSGNPSDPSNDLLDLSFPDINLPIALRKKIPDLNIPIADRKRTRTCTKHPMSNYLSYDKLSHTHKAYVSRISNLFVPRTIQEALGDPNWKLAVKEEMDALRKNNTWSITDLPHDKRAVGCKWVFTVKCKADGNVERYKARLVAKGFTQTHGIDYQETFAPVAKINSIRILLSLAVNFNWTLHQFDVKNAFLNGELHEEVYMSLPPGFEENLGRDKVCRLKKSLYGLKQSPRAWFERFGNVVKKHGFTQSQADHTLFFKHSHEGKIAILIVYVDDIIMTGDDVNEISDLKRRLEAEFDIKDLGKLKYFLGMEFARSKEGIFLNQRKYILDLLTETGMTGCKAVETPMDPNVKLKAASEDEVVDRERYQRLAGRLIYLSHTRPDIAFAVSVISQFMHAPGPTHFEAIFRILRYLKGTPGKGLMFKNRGHIQVEAYTDADWAGNINDRRSTSGYCTFVGGNLVTWRSKKQNVVARSSAEAEFRSVAHGFCEVLWIKKFMEELKVSSPTPIKVYCDNKAAISIAHNPVLHDRTKHVEVDKHFIKEKIDSGEICMSYVPTTSQVADVLTKSLSKRQFDDMVSKLAMNDIFMPA